MAEPKPVAWMVESKFGSSVHLHEQQARAEATFPGSRITPLYPGPFRVERGYRSLSLVRRLVSEWEPDRE